MMRARPSHALSFENSNDIASAKTDWHKHKFELQPDETVTLRVAASDGTLVFERSCAVHPRALTLTYAEFRS